MPHHQNALSAFQPRGVRATLAAGLLACVLAGPASAQIIGGTLPSLPSANLPRADLPDTSRGQPPRLRARPDLSRATGAAQALTAETFAGARRLALEALVRANPATLEVDDEGAAVVRGEILALSAGPAMLARLEAAGFAVKRRPGLGDLGLELTVLAAPAGLSAPEAVRRIRAIDPAGEYDFNHLYAASGAILAAAGTTGARTSPTAVRIGLIDSGVDVRHPALKGARIDQRGFAPGGIAPRAHGLATAALLAGAQGPFRGAAPGAHLHVADVYGSTAAGGSATSLAEGLAWMAQVKAPVVNVSLVGPPNLTIRAVTRALVARGHLIVAAVGNDGPAAPPLYPAAYPGVVAVTAVDGRGRLLPEAGRPGRIDFAAPGADMAVPAQGGGFVAVRGSSFAAPIVAGRLARHLAAPDPAAAARARAAVAREARDLGARGPDRLYGHGLVGADLATRPAQVAAQGVLAAP